MTAPLDPLGGAGLALALPLGGAVPLGLLDPLVWLRRFLLTELDERDLFLLRPLLAGALLAGML